MADGLVWRTNASCADWWRLGQYKEGEKKGMVVLGGSQPRHGAWWIILGDRKVVADINGDGG